jgi:predicted DCC family thiol-disulfide oxidoreductase YuxK
MKVYYNNSCNICRAEINLYKKQNIENIEWVDITNNKIAEEETDKSDKDLLRRLHVKDGKEIIGGAKAFLLLWKEIPKYKILYIIFKTPIIYNLFSVGYEIIAFFLYLKNKKQLYKD